MSNFCIMYQLCHNWTVLKILILIFCCTELFKMVCEENETDVDIGIPAVMLPQDAGTNIERHLEDNATGFYGFLCISVPCFGFF